MANTNKVDTFQKRLIDYIKTITLGCNDSDFHQYINYLEFISEEIDFSIKAENNQ